MKKLIYIIDHATFYKEGERKVLPLNTFTKDIEVYRKEFKKTYNIDRVLFQYEKRLVDDKDIEKILNTENKKILTKL